MDENLVEYQQMLKAADAQMAKEIEDMSKGKYVRIKHGSPSFTNQRLETIRLTAISLVTHHLPTN